MFIAHYIHKNTHAKLTHNSQAYIFILQSVSLTSCYSHKNQILRSCLPPHITEKLHDVVSLDTK